MTEGNVHGTEESQIEGNGSGENLQWERVCVYLYMSTWKQWRGEEYANLGDGPHFRDGEMDKIDKIDKIEPPSLQMRDLPWDVENGRCSIRQSIA